LSLILSQPIFGRLFTFGRTAESVIRSLVDIADLIGDGRASALAAETVNVSIIPFLPGHGLIASEGGRPATFQKGLGIEVPEDFNQGSHEPGPSGLMTGADAGAVVAMKVLVEQ